MDDSPEERNRYLNELGRPVEASGYKLESIDRATQPPEVINLLDKYSAMYHEQGLTEAQADGVSKEMLDIAAQNMAARAQANDQRAEATTSALKEKWGMAYDARIDLAERAGRQIFGKDTLDAFAKATLPDGSRVGDSPEFIEALYDNLGSKMTEDEIAGGTAVKSSVMTPEGAQDEIKKLEVDEGHNHAYFDKNDPMHEMAVKKMKALYDMAYPNERT
jgi:hypothetical protein